jgi:glycosyltransferase involved in cell wall biosynthesis
MRVSIVIPVYNGSNYLAEAIDSALAQTYGDVEIIVVNDGSRDEGATERIALGYGDRIRYIAQPNGGVSSALNTGIREMTGQWFCWLSHDDRFLPRKTEVQASFAVANPDARVIGCDFELIDTTGRVFDVWHSSVSLKRSGRDVIGGWVFGCALMIHREVLDACGPFNEANRTTQDLEMWLHVIEHAPIHWLPDILCQLRQHPEAGSRKERRYTQDKNDLFARLLERYDATFYDPEATTPSQRAEVFAWLARNAVGRDAYHAARMCSRRAWREWPSIRNPALGLLLLGVRGWLLKLTVAAKSRNVLARLGLISR